MTTEEVLKIVQESGFKSRLEVFELKQIVAFINNQAEKLREAENLIWQLTDGSETTNKDGLHKCHYCNETSWGDIDHKKDCIVKKAEEFYYKENKWI